MSVEAQSGYNDQVHFRVASDFVPMVHLAARKQGLTASAFMRRCIILELQRSEVQYATPKTEMEKEC